MDTVKAKLLAVQSVVPVVTIEQVKDASPLARAVAAGGGKSIEITLRTEAGLAAIRALAEDDCGLVVGAGTVLTPEQAEAVIAAGASFVVSPGLDLDVLDVCLAANVLPIPGVMTPTEVQGAIAEGLDFVKFFPAELGGGVKMLKTFASVYRQVRFMPTGGVSLDNLATYVACSNVAAIGGSWVCQPELIRAGRFDEITRLMQEAMAVLSR